MYIIVVSPPNSLTDNKVLDQTGNRTTWYIDLLILLFQLIRKRDPELRNRPRS